MKSNETKVKQTIISFISNNPSSSNRPFNLSRIVVRASRRSRKENIQNKTKNKQTNEYPVLFSRSLSAMPTISSFFQSIAAPVSPYRPTESRDNNDNVLISTRESKKRKEIIIVASQKSAFFPERVSNTGTFSQQLGLTVSRASHVIFSIWKMKSYSQIRFQSLISPVF